MKRVQNQRPSPPGTFPRPSPQQAAWQDLEIGLFVHFGPATWQGREYDDLSTPLAAINPSRLDTDRWAQAAVAVGARYILMVAKHTGGFCFWPTATTDYSIAHTPWRDGRGDVMADLRRSCDAQGLKLGVYLSPQDAKHGAGVGGRCATPEAQAAYDRLYRRQLTELLTAYGPMVEVWFDGSLVTPVGDLLGQYANQAVFFQGPQASIRWNGNESGITPDPSWTTVWTHDRRSGVATAIHSQPEGDTWLPLECDFPIRDHYWFWRPGAESSVRTLDELLAIYYGSVGRGAQMVINLSPDTTGGLPEPDCGRAVEFGREIRRRFDRPIAETRGQGECVALELAAPTTLDHLVVMEDILRGERVRRYVLEGRAGAEWTPLYRGAMIGHKRIASFRPRTVSAVRLRCLEAWARPQIRRLAAYCAGLKTPATPPPVVEVWGADRIGVWEARRFGAKWSEVDFEFNEHVCRQAGQYRLALALTEGEAPLEIQSVVLLQDGLPYPGQVEADKTGGTYRLNITGVGAKLGVRLTVRAGRDPAAKGELLLRKADWPALARG